MTSPPGLLSMNSICLLCRARPNWTHYYHHHYLPTHLLHHLLVLLVFLHKHVAHFLQSLCVVPNLTEHLCFSKHSPLVHYLKKAFGKQERYYLRLVHCRATSALPRY